MQLTLRFLTICLLLMSRSVLAQTVYVTPTGAGNQSGTSWSNALSGTALQGALASAPSGTTFLIGTGMYKPTTGTDRSVSFSIPSGVHVYGGYAGSGSESNTRTAFPSSTTFSGDIGTMGNSSDNTYNVVRFRNATADTRLDGLVITGGNANEGSRLFGGGIYNDGDGSGNSSKPTLVNLSLISNSSSFAGGALYNTGVIGEASPRLINVEFNTNSASQRGGAIMNNGGNGNASPVLINVSFNNNVAGLGGAIYSEGLSGNSHPQLTNVSFSSNSAISSGGALFSYNASVSVNNGVFFNSGGANTFAGLNGSVTLHSSLLEPTVTNYTTDPSNLTTTTFPFVSTTDLRLRPGAEAINTGDNTAYTTAGGPLTDLGGNPRRLGTIDMGAYEYLAFPANSVVYVTPSGAGQLDGSSWVNALQGQAFQPVLANATSSTFLVGAGLYKPTTGTDRSVCFSIPSGVQVYGGYVGNGPSPDTRTTFPISTTLSADIGTLNDNSDNSFNVVRFRNASETTRLDGVVLTGGNATLRFDSVLYVARGGGIFNDGSGEGNRSSPTLVNLWLINNTATNGGGLYNWASTGTTSPKLINVGFENNSATRGGAIFNFSGLGVNKPVLVNVSFRNNSATILGGAMFNNNADVRVANGIFFGNGGANTFNNIVSSLTITSSLLEPSVTSYASDPSNLTTTTSPFASETKLQLNACSPAINTGSNSAYTTFSGPPIDLAGNARFYQNGPIDMGAYEFQGTPSQPLGITQQPPSGTAVCAGATLTATVSVTGSNPTYQWYKDGVSLSAQQSATLTLPNVTTAQTGSYSVVITNACNSVTATAFSLTVNALPTPTLVSSGTITCAQTSVTLTATGGSSYTFAGSGIVSQNATSGTAMVNAPGPYSVSVTTSSGCSSTTSLTVEQNTTPASVSISPASATITCSNPVVSLSAVGVGTYRWSTGEITPSISVSVANTYSVTLTGANGCSSTASASVIYQNCAPTVANLIPPKSATIGDAFSYTIPASTFTDPETPNALTLSMSGLPAGLSFVAPNTITGVPSTTIGTPFSVTVTATDPGGLTASTSFLLNVQSRGFAITGVTMLDCNHISYFERRINFTVSFEGINGQPISLSVVNETKTITINEPYQLNLFTDNPVIVFKARQQGTSSEASFAYNWLAFCANGNPRVENSIPAQSATVGQPFSYTIPANTFTDAETPNSLTLSVVGLPAGLSFVVPNRITGTASASASAFYSVTVTATDPAGGSVSTILPFSVVNPGGCGSMFTLKAGDWNDPAVWSCGRIPVLTDAVTLNHVVSLPPTYQAQALRVIYSPTGRLIFGSTSRLRLVGN
ncbi:immunoglobulin domain-containing protein [Spirosoma sp. BT702]|uniref:Immunoglobulin domain-containing protein n=1 Tax=Spirosoma profusum TaxID=2771354 RepID=A0A927AU61_9BACT|nr:putative Ig domain-containing protein [Spirosoma profusum]MBD2702627.1 immunoglobulin domain-containing protein [Spirosoma profusum]